MLLMVSEISSADARAALVRLLAAAADPAQAAALADIPALTVIAAAERHRLSPLVSSTCVSRLPATLADRFRRDRVANAARTLLLTHVAEETTCALDSAGVPVILLKGLDYDVRLYGGGAVRPTGDVDLLVPGHARRTAFEVLDRLGFEPRAAAPGFDDSDYHEVAWQRAGVEIDLHLALAPLVRCAIDYGAVWRHATPQRIGETDTLVLARGHAAVFQALHMAIDHFDVPAIYLVDFARLLPDRAAVEAAAATAAAWRCARPFATAAALTQAFVPHWLGYRNEPSAWSSRQIVDGYGTLQPLPRRAQLERKLAHIDTVSDVVRYLAVQSLRNAREAFERRVRRRSARERLRLKPAP
jgi:putative nucleotidyltransferase-like protein